MGTSILLVEDDPSIRELTGLALERDGFDVATAFDGAQALDVFNERPFDGVVLDVMLPSLDGIEVCRRIRDSSEVPVVMLTARTETEDVVRALEVGADDYVKKPFEIPELIARIRAALRRAQSGPVESKLELGDIEIDARAFVARKNGRPLRLTATEFRLLLELARRLGEAVTRESLLENVWGYSHLGDSRLVDMAIKRLRDKVEDDPSDPALIATIRGVGYKLQTPP